MAADVRTPVPHESVDLAALASSAVGSARVTAEQAKIHLRVKVDEGQAIVVTGAPGALGRYVIASVDNAIEQSAS